MTWHAASVLLAAAGSIPIDGDNVRGWLTRLAGNVFLAIVVVRGAFAVFRARLLELVILAAVAVLCATFVYAPDVFRGLSQSLVAVLQGAA